MTNEMVQIPDNVWQYLDIVSDQVGKMEAARFRDEMHCQIVEKPIASPIEQLFFVALQALVRAEYLEVNPAPELVDGAYVIASGINIDVQHAIGNYRVDFLVTRTQYRETPTRDDAVIVELDGHAFHDRDKRQRSYEKARDRFLQRQGYRVLHFTGSDVVSDPYRVAHEVLSTIGVFGLESQSRTYDPSNPLGID